jgi:hypothetical protein
VVRIAPNSLSFNNSRAYADIYGVRANVAKDERYAGLSVSRRTPNLITCTESGLMRFKRKVHAQFLGGQNLEALEGRVLGHVGVFVDVLGSGRDGGDATTQTMCDDRGEWSRPFNLARVTNWLTLDIITDLVLGVRSGLLTDARNRWFAKAIQTMSWRGVLVRCFHFRSSIVLVC